MDSLDSYIKELEKLTQKKFYEDKIKKAFNEIIKKMIEYQIYDSNQSRGIFVSIAKKDLGIDNMQMLKTAINHWKEKYKEERDVNSGKYKSTLKYLDGLYDLTFEIEEDSVYQQEHFNIKYPAEIEKRDNTPFKLGHLTYVCDVTNSGQLSEFEKVLEEILISIEEVI